MACRLTKEERERISQMHYAGANRAEIGRVIGRHPTTIGRELRRNGDGTGRRPRRGVGRG
ncbi:MAG: helix-turn-helix domain-containing protein, partial [Planctomycetaceae bacterium]